MNTNIAGNLNHLKQVLTLDNKKLLQGKQTQRKHICSFCGSKIGNKIGAFFYWDIADLDVVQCSACRHMQVDPMLSEEQLVKGCSAYDVYQRQSLSYHKFTNIYRREFRTAVRFSAYLENNHISPKHIAEIGPGGGYFARGLSEMFPKAEITCIDIVDQILEDIKRSHGFNTMLSIPENLDKLPSEQFDFIYSRDLLEHLTNPAKFLSHCFHLLKPGGYLYILTPNGYEDIWPTYLRWQLSQQPSDLIINHLNYFDALTLIAPSYRVDR